MAALPPGTKLSTLQTLKYARDPYGFLEKQQATHGDPFWLGTRAGDAVVTGSPAGIQQIYTADPDTFVPFSPQTVEFVLGPGSLLVLSGARHRRERKLLMPAFHGERMRAYGETIRTAALAAASAWPRGQVFELQTTTQWISLEVIVRAVFGVTEAARVETFRAALIDLVDAVTPGLLFFPRLRRRFGGIGPYARLLRAQQRLDVLIAAEIAERRARGEGGEDILGRMLAARDEDGAPMASDELRDELLTLLFAGHETTGVALAWAMYGVLRDPAVHARLLAELDAVGERPEPDALARLPYLDAVCNEALRLHPIVTEISRTLARPFELCGYTLPAGATVMAATALLHVRPDLYPQPRAFRPERFLERRFGPFEFTPFGGGARRCLGAAFALHEMKIALATLLGRHALRLAEPRPLRPARRNLVLGPSTGVRVVLLGPRAAGDPPRAA